MRRVYFAMRLVVSFLRELVLANIAVARIVVARRLRIRPGIVAYPTALHSDLAVTALANMITLTPGTFTLDIAPDKKTLYIHTLNISRPEDVVASIRSAFEKNLLELEE